MPHHLHRLTPVQYTRGPPTAIVSCQMRAKINFLPASQIFQNVLENAELLHPHDFLNHTLDVVVIISIPSSCPPRFPAKSIPRSPTLPAASSCPSLPPALASFARRDATSCSGASRSGRSRPGTSRSGRLDFALMKRLRHNSTNLRRRQTLVLASRARTDGLLTPCTEESNNTCPSRTSKCTTSSAV